MFGDEKAISLAQDNFLTLGKVRFVELVKRMCEQMDPSSFGKTLESYLGAYLVLKLARYSIVEDIENLMVDDPEEATVQLAVCASFIVNPLRNLRWLINYTLYELKETINLPLIYQPRENTFPM